MQYMQAVSLHLRKKSESNMRSATGCIRTYINSQVRSMIACVKLCTNKQVRSATGCIKNIHQQLSKGNDWVYQTASLWQNKNKQNPKTCTSSMCLMFALLDCLFLKRCIQQNKECNFVKGKNEFFFAKSLQFGEVQMGHLHTSTAS